MPFVPGFEEYASFQLVLIIEESYNRRDPGKGDGPGIGDKEGLGVCQVRAKDSSRL